MLKKNYKKCSEQKTDHKFQDILLWDKNVDVKWMEN